MKTLLHLTFMLLLSSVSNAQQYYFAYVQTDNKQPFYVKVNEKLMSSSSSGYVVIPKLTAGKYVVTVGFPKEQWPQQSIPLTINNTDAGFLLKNFGEKGWGLYNLQTMEIAMNGSVGSAMPTTKVTNDDVFTNTLSGASNTDLAANKPIIVEKPVIADKPITLQEPQKIKDLVETEKPVNVVSKITIQKIGSSVDADGKSYIYVDRTENTNDTIHIFIPVVKPTITIPIAKTNKELEDAKEVGTIKEDAKPQKFLDIDLQNPNAKNTDLEAKAISIDVKAAESTTTSPIIPVATYGLNKPTVNFNSDCKTTAGDNDFLKLRRKMAASTSDDAMVDAAKKTFKTTCFSVEQIKNLSLLFLNDAGKYNFFDASYAHIYDTQNFGTLQNQLTDKYFLTRFKAMIRN